MVALLSLLLALVATPAATDPPRRVRLLEPSWATGEVSLDARILVVAEVSPPESLVEVWLELRGQDRGWERRAIPFSKWLCSPVSTLVAVAIEPRAIPWLQAGGEFEIQVRSSYRDGDGATSTGVVVRPVEPELRELGL